MGSLTQLLGMSPRVAILEAFGEDPGLEFSVPELVRQTGISKRSVYIHVRRLLDEGIIQKAAKKGKCQFYTVNPEDVRGRMLGFLETVFTLGKVERELKVDYELSPSQPLPPPPFGSYPTWRDVRPVVAPRIMISPFTTSLAPAEARLGAVFARTSGSTIAPEVRRTAEDVFRASESAWRTSPGTESAYPTLGTPPLAEEEHDRRARFLQQGVTA